MKFDVVFEVSIVVLFFVVLGSFALCLHFLKLSYQLFCVVVNSLLFIFF